MSDNDPAPATPGDPSPLPSMLWAWAGVLPALAVTVATCLVLVPPFADLPFHLSAAEIRLAHDDVPALAHHYGLNDEFGPNSLYHALAVAAGAPVGMLRLTQGLALLGSFALVLLLARQHRTGPIFPLAAGLALVHFSLVLGFIEFAVAMPAVLLLTWQLGRAPTEPWPPTRRLAAWALGVAATLLACFFAHAIATIFCFCVLGCFALLRAWRTPRVTVAAAIAALPAIVALAAWKLSRPASDAGGVGWMYYYYLNVFPIEYGQRLGHLLAGNATVFVSPTIAFVLASLFNVTALVAAVLCLRRGLIARRDADERLRASDVAAPLALVATALAVALLAPPGYPPFWYVYRRFTFATVIGLALLGGALAGRRYAPRLLLAGLVIANAAQAALWFEHILSFGPVPRDLVALLDEHRPSGLGAYVVGDIAYRGDDATLRHTSNLAIIGNRLPAQSELYDFPFARVVRGPGLGEAVPFNQPHFERVADLLAAAEAFGWALVHASVDAEERRALDEAATLLGERGDWSVYDLAAGRDGR